MNIKRQPGSTTTNEKIKWDLFQRFKLIELTAQWEGRLSTKHLRAAFGIGRAQASRDISVYLQRHPGNIHHDVFAKGYVPTNKFIPYYSKGTAEEYLALLNENKGLSDKVIGISEFDSPLEVVGMPPRQTDPKILQVLLGACRNKMRIDVLYASQSNPDDREGRIIAPHTVVNSGYRWHVRAYCEKQSDYRDFMLSRFLEVPEIESKSENDPSEDEKWHTVVTIKLIPHPELSPEMKIQIMKERGMTNGVLEIPCRGSLVHYQLMHMQVPTYENPKLLSNPVIVANREELASYFFNR